MCTIFKVGSALCKPTQRQLLTRMKYGSKICKLKLICDCSQSTVRPDSSIDQPQYSLGARACLSEYGVFMPCPCSAFTVNQSFAGSSAYALLTLSDVSSDFSAGRCIIFIIR